MAAAATVAATAAVAAAASAAAAAATAAPRPQWQRFRLGRGGTENKNPQFYKNTENAKIEFRIFVVKISQDRSRSTFSGRRFVSFQLVLPIDFEISFFRFFANGARFDFSYNSRMKSRILILSRVL